MTEPTATACDICADTGTDYIGRPCRRCRPAMPERTFSGLTYTLTRGGRRAECRACGDQMPNANEALYEHAARCPSKGWAHGF